jgi:hypothetical protein
VPAADADARSGFSHRSAFEGLPDGVSLGQVLAFKQAALPLGIFRRGCTAIDVLFAFSEPHD